jgi:hypothetical protein
MKKQRSCLSLWICRSSGDKDIATACLLLQEERAQKRRCRGLIPGHAVCDRKRLDGDYQLYRDYFAQYLSLIVTSLGECVV